MPRQPAILGQLVERSPKDESVRRLGTQRPMDLSLHAVPELMAGCAPCWCFLLGRNVAQHPVASNEPLREEIVLVPLEFTRPQQAATGPA
jgi:hypothetical protein